MSRKLLKLLILTAMALPALASSASATGWTSNGSAGGAPFNLTAPASKMTPAGASWSVNCTTTSATGSLFGPTGLLTQPVAKLTLAFTGCRIGFTSTASCTANAINFLVASYSSPIVTGQLVAAATPICTFTVLGTMGCTVTMVPTNGLGTAIANVTYNDTTRQLAATTTGQQLTLAWSSCSQLFPTASGSTPMTFTTTAGSSLIYTVTSTFVPNIII
jgi:hypothetical protein